jgi:phenylalanyl-tRNA synthetase beta chain
VLNPIASPLSVMRSSLLGSLVAVLQSNLARQASRVRVFETGRVFRRDASAVDGETAVAGLIQPRRVSGLAWGRVDPLQWGSKERAVDFFDVKGDVETLLAPRGAAFVAGEHPAMHPGRCARVELAGRPIGHVGELHPRWRQGYELPSAPILFELDLDALLERDLPAFTTISRQQAAVRDIALVAGDQVTHASLMDAIGAGRGGLVRSARLFDIYKPAAATPDLKAGERSLAVRLELLDNDNTLTDERIEATVAEVLATLQARLGVRLRG